MDCFIKRTKFNSSKYCILFALAFNGLSGNVSVEKKQSVWKKVKSALLSKPAKIAYGVVATMLVGRYWIKCVGEKERARSLRNGSIVFSWLGEKQGSDLVERFRDRYMPNSRDSRYHYRPYYYGIEQWIIHDVCVEIIIKDNGILQGDSTSLLHKICRDIHDMNAYATSEGNPMNWTAVVEKQEPLKLHILPLSDDFDAIRYQVRITIPNVISTI